MRRMNLDRVESALPRKFCGAGERIDDAVDLRGSRFAGIAFFGDRERGRADRRRRIGGVAAAVRKLECDLSAVFVDDVRCDTPEIDRFRFCRRLFYRRFAFRRNIGVAGDDEPDSVLCEPGVEIRERGRVKPFGIGESLVSRRTDKAVAEQKSAEKCRFKKMFFHKKLPRFPDNVLRLLKKSTSRVY